MFKINATSKYRDLSSDTKIYYILAIGIFISILSFVLYRGFIVTLTIAVCCIVMYISFSKKPKQELVQLDSKGLSVDGDFIDWNSCIGWASLELENNMLEFVIETTSLQRRFWYFYMHTNQQGVKEFILELGKYLPYDPIVPSKNIIHNILRRLGIM
jgi:hypothetical protein